MKMRKYFLQLAAVSLLSLALIGVPCAASAAAGSAAAPDGGAAESTVDSTAATGGGAAESAADSTAATKGGAAESAVDSTAATGSGTDESAAGAAVAKGGAAESAGSAVNPTEPASSGMEERIGKALEEADLELPDDIDREELLENLRLLKKTFGSEDTQSLFRHVEVRELIGILFDKVAAFSRDDPGLAEKILTTLGLKAADSRMILQGLEVLDKVKGELAGYLDTEEGRNLNESVRAMLEDPELSEALEELWSVIRDFADTVKDILGVAAAEGAPAEGGAAAGKAGAAVAEDAAPEEGTAAKEDKAEAEDAASKEGTAAKADSTAAEDAAAKEGSTEARAETSEETVG